jgi:transposase
VASVAGYGRTSTPSPPGLTLPYSDGPSEGANTKVKLLKRQMYGRAGFSLLRQRILLS